jgi:hypothetical protein
MATEGLNVMLYMLNQNSIKFDHVGEELSYREPRARGGVAGILIWPAYCPNTLYLMPDLRDLRDHPRST